MVASGCDSGIEYIVAENRSDQPLLIRKTETVYGGESMRQVETVLLAPVGSRITVGTETFTGPRVNRIDILHDDCSVVTTVFPYDGRLILIDATLAVDQRAERPSAGDSAAATERCPTPLPSTSPSIEPSGLPSASPSPSPR
jgi:hypothetical protein